MSASGSGGKCGKNPVAEEIDQLITNHKVVVFSKTFCPYCTKAKKILGKYKINSYKVLELDKMPNGDKYVDILAEMTGEDTVPRVFIGGECIGGGDDTEKLEKQGELENKLREINALEN